MTKQEAIEEAAKNSDKSKCKHFRREFTKHEVYDSFEDGFIVGANWYKENESKPQIDINKLRDEFFDECVDKRAFCEIGESFDRVVSLAPHDMFEWIKNKLTTKL